MTESETARARDPWGHALLGVARELVRLHDDPDGPALDRLREMQGGLQGVAMLMERHARELRAYELTAENLRARIAAYDALAAAAIGTLNQWDESISSYAQGTSDGTTAADLAERLDALREGAC